MEEKAITPFKVAVITASDRSARGGREDRSGTLLCNLLEKWGAEVAVYQVVPDERKLIHDVLCRLSDVFQCDLVLTTGGTGLGPRDVTPEATRDVLEKEIPGIAESIREQGRRANPHAALSRALAGVRGRTLIVNLPGSPSAIHDAFEVLQPILPHALSLIRGEVRDCQTFFSSSH